MRIRVVWSERWRLEGQPDHIQSGNQLVNAADVVEAVQQVLGRRPGADQIEGLFAWPVPWRPEQTQEVHSDTSIQPEDLDAASLEETHSLTNQDIPALLPPFLEEILPALQRGCNKTDCFCGSNFQLSGSCPVTMLLAYYGTQQAPQGEKGKDS